LGVLSYFVGNHASVVLIHFEEERSCVSGISDDALVKLGTTPGDYVPMRLSLAVEYVYFAVNAI